MLSASLSVKALVRPPSRCRAETPLAKPYRQQRSRRENWRALPLFVGGRVLAWRCQPSLGRVGRGGNLRRVLRSSCRRIRYGRFFVPPKKRAAAAAGHEQVGIAKIG